MDQLAQFLILVTHIQWETHSALCNNSYSLHICNMKLMKGNNSYYVCSFNSFWFLRIASSGLLFNGNITILLCLKNLLFIDLFYQYSTKTNNFIPRSQNTIGEVRDPWNVQAQFFSILLIKIYYEFNEILRDIRDTLGP